MSCCWKSGDKIHIYYLLWFTWFLNFFKKPRLFPSCFVSFLKCVTGWCIFFLIYILWPSPKLCFSSQDLIFDMFWLSAPPCRGLLPAYESLVVSIIVSLFPLIGPPVLGAFKYLQLNHIFIHFCNEQAQQNTQRVSTLSSCWMCWTVSTPLKRYWTVQTPQEITEQSISNWVILTTDEPNSGTVLRSSKLLRFRITRVHAVVSRWKQSRKKLANRKGPKHLGPYQQVKCMSYSMTNLHAWNSLYTHHSRRMSVWGPYVFFYPSTNSANNSDLSSTTCSPNISTMSISPTPTGFSELVGSGWCDSSSHHRHQLFPNLIWTSGDFRVLNWFQLGNEIPTSS